MQYQTRKSNAGFILWGDMYELKALWTLIHRIQDESAIIKSEDGTLMDFAYELRHAFDRMRRTSTRDWYGEDETPVYGMDCYWPEVLAQVGLMRAAMAFMPTITRNDQAVMYGLEATVLDALEQMLPGAGENFLSSVARNAQQGEKQLRSRIVSRTCYFLTLTPAARKKHLGAIVDSMGSIWARDNYLDPSLFEQFEDWTNYPEHKF